MDLFRPEFAIIAALVLSGCGDDAVVVECTCADGACSVADECPVVISWPAACFGQGQSYDVSLEGGAGLVLAGAATTATACTGITFGQSATVGVDGGPGGWPDGVPATCFTRGAAAELPVCPVEFVVSPGCAGSIESWDVEIDEQAVGTASLDAPLAPCEFVSESQTREFAARGGGLVSRGSIAGCGAAGGVLTVTLSCR